MRQTALQLNTCLMTLGLRAPLSGQLQGTLDIAAANIGARFQKSKVDLFRSVLTRVLAARMGSQPL